LAATAAPFLGIHNKAASPPPGLKNAVPNPDETTWFVLRASSNHTLIYCLLGERTLAHARTKRLARVREFSHGQFL
jgi:hypothetical protein